MSLNFLQIAARTLIKIIIQKFKEGAPKQQNMTVGYLQKKNLWLIIHLIQSNILWNILIKKKKKVFEKKHRPNLMLLFLAIKNFRTYL